MRRFKGIPSFLGSAARSACCFAALCFFLSGCSTTSRIVRTEKTEEVPVVQSGEVQWVEIMNISDLGLETVKEGMTEFEVGAGRDSSAAAPVPAKVKLHYRLKYRPAESVEMSVDSAVVETKKEIKTVTVAETKIIEKKIWKTFALLATGIMLALGLVIFFIVKRFTR